MNFDALLFVLLMLALGYLCARTRVLPDNAAEVLNQFVLVLCLPAAILHHVPKLRFGADIVGVALVPWLVLGLSIAAIVPIARWLRLRKNCRICQPALPCWDSTTTRASAIFRLRGSCQPEAT